MKGTAGLIEDSRPPPHLCPIDTAKVLNATGADEIELSEALLAYCKRFVRDRLFSGFAVWLKCRLRELKDLA